jgi:hypothetical protein
MEALEVQVQLHSSGRDIKDTNCLVDIDIAGDLTEREHKILFNSAKTCEVGKILNDKVDFRYQIKCRPKVPKKRLG